MTESLVKVAEESLRDEVFAAAKYAAHVFRERVRECMEKKGLSSEVSRAIAEDATRDPKLLSKIVAEEEYGVKEETLEDPVRAGLYTGMSYMLGAALPLILYFLGLSALSGLALSLVLASLALAVTGSLVALFANIPVKKKAAEMVLLGLGSAAATYAIGRVASLLLGVNVG